MTEYAEAVDVLVAAMNERLDELNAEMEQGSLTLDQIAGNLNGRVAAHSGFVSGMRGLDVPDDAEELHATTLDVMGQLAAAEAALADRVRSLDTNVGIDAILETPEGQALLEVDERAIVLCNAAQAEFDRTEQREAFADVPWVPPSMKEVIRVAFRCATLDR
jgi:hypothetical protein